MLDVLMLAEPECEANYRDMIQEHKNAYLQRYVTDLAIEMCHFLKIESRRNTSSYVIKRESLSNL